MDDHATGRCPFALDPAGTDIHAEADELRRRGPATQVELPGGVVVWSVNHYSGAKQILKDPLVTKSARDHWTAFVNNEIPPDWELISWITMDNMATATGKNQVRLRRLVSKAFSPKRIEALRPRIEELVDELVDSLGAVAPGEVVDLRERFCYPLPARLMADMLGMSEQSRAKTAQVMDMMVNTTVSPEEAQALLIGWQSAIADLIELKQHDPGEDITSDLILARDDENSKLTQEELLGTLFAILGAGTSTTVDFLGKFLVELLTHREQLDRVLAGEVSWDEAIEEGLRIEGPVAHLPLRYAVEDIDIDGVTIPRGDAILVNYAGVGRDPEVHGDTAGEFDVDRAEKTHLAFGVGPHFCLGWAIAREEVKIGLGKLFARFPDLELAVDRTELQATPTFIMNGYRSVPVRLAATRSGADRTVAA
ncbi:cytochrome P450 [Amycolatopsis mediterranei S699]|uniref:Cytochrome P450 n=2 Tax=Amycolatopsis mediterranei TaxID=33910 RepID=A0A0H3DG02_AMYMU|nr:cytochrome P450 [Amycolatopsis mediterranei]ADJ49053.1 cytochrome P450 [Amycolatopsis mediterranei U32]AEK46012.1 cytochrome P450 [Amycolatopsis mediterranei S699]AFO80761.1 cytochrome P450 [Amycolatopsis mediterranei S699]AGT87889.1 cytochrome P450 [Amycolatopsis mediterranei RB]KDO04032.1 cytochrome P450 [Amycolatopsis mediterranei]